MKFTRLYLQGYKPLLYGGTTKIDITDISQITILSGENGKGKSSILRELTPYPASKPDYEKNGMKIIEIIHGIGNDHYVLTSDFSKTKIHSFIYNGEEKNLSGTGEVQSDLVNYYFSGFTPLVEKLTSGQCKMSAMNKFDRKQLIMATYPSSLLFILEKHKNLCSKIRAGNNQIKLMSERMLKIKESLISDETLNVYNTKKDLMNKAILELDKEIYSLNEKINDFKENEYYKTVIDYNFNDIKQEADDLSKAMCLLLEDGYHKLPESKLDAKILSCKFKLDQIESTIEENIRTGKDLTEEIEKYHNYLANDNEQAINDCKRLIDVANEEISENTIYICPVTTFIEDATAMREHASEIKEKLDYLKELNIQFISYEEYNNRNMKLQSLIQQYKTNEKEIESVIKILKNLKEKLNSYNEKSYPENCIYVCKLRDSIRDIIHSTKVEFDYYDERYDDLIVENQELETEIKSLKTELEVCNTAMPFIDYFDRLFSHKSWGDFVCFDKNLIDALNSDIMEIWNRYVKIIKQTEANDKVKKAKEKIQLLTSKLATLEASTQPAKQMITDMLIKKEAILGKLTDQISSLENERDIITKEYEHSSKHKELIDQLKTFEDKVIVFANKFVISKCIQFCESIVADKEQIKIDLSSHLREQESIVREQENLRTRLHDEIEPVLKELNTNNEKWKLIEEQLSPVSGIPHIYTIQYINKLFAKANLFIKKVWNYNMSLAYLDEKDDCDFSFKVIMNNDDEVKDISICSKGQKEIIDLAIMIAICTYCGFSKQFPLKLDEMTNGLSPDHAMKLFEVLGEMFHNSDIIQSFIVNHDPVIASGYSDAGYAVLSEDYPLPSSCRVITKIN